MTPLEFANKLGFKNEYTLLAYAKSLKYNTVQEFLDAEIPDWKTKADYHDKE